ncbi:hypothetical protein PGT21_024900 [Puccinia graminis f. sp. tritici]|uniref:Uncharacterized protein n=1 Tax=Puccinia graminis f. sp. tritici TaxID=56615 RepID=A0A5B0QBQ4_PUCGR|nr:hypothetical protein PGT21_024900 [Puccinia graminis f. sp. tritici]
MSDEHRPEYKPQQSAYRKPISTLSKTGCLTPGSNSLCGAIEKQQTSDATLFKGKETARSETPEETVYQPRIADKPTAALSSTNWLRQDPPPHLKPNPTLQLLTEMKAQCDADQARRDRDEEQLQCRTNLEEQTRIASTVAAVAKRMADDGILQPDGSNLHRWERMLCMHSMEQFGDPNFFTPDEGPVIDSTDEKIGRGILNSSVHRDLIYDLLSLGSSAAVFAHIVAKFRSVNRAAQLKAWRDFILVDPSKHNTTAGILAAFNETARVFDEVEVLLNLDEMMGLILQANL